MNPRMPAWGDQQIARFKYRAGLFQRRGMPPLAAEALADRLAFRDYELDPRRACVECENHQRGNTCHQRAQPALVGQLINCPKFSFQKP